MWYSQTGHRGQYNTEHALCMQDNCGYRHTLRACATYCFPRQQRSCERASVLGYTYIGRLVCVSVVWTLRDTMQYSSAIAVYV
jgi:hypothetical protein